VAQHGPKWLAQWPPNYPSEIDIFEDYELKCIEYDGIDEKTAMTIFVMLQGGKSLTKTEVRSALGGKLCDFVTELTDSSKPADDEEDEQEKPKNHFFKALSENLANRRKSHRNVADVLLHEFFYPDKDKHWSSLQTMYQEKANSLSANDKTDFKSFLNRFYRETLVDVKSKRVMMPQLRSPYFILTVFKVFRSLKRDYTLPSGFKFADAIRDFETQRVIKRKKSPFLNFSSALSNAGYAQHRIQERHDILMTYALQKNPDIKAKKIRGKRLFTLEQKIAIWERAKGKCEISGCKETFSHPREADADHIVMWKNGGDTTIENGRLLCKKHNRSRKS